MDETVRRLEAILFVEGDAVPKAKLQRLLGLQPDALARSIAALKTALRGHALTVVETDTAVALRSTEELSAFLSERYHKEHDAELGQAAMEVLAIVFYQNGATKAEIDHIRGVNSSFSLRTLLIRGLIERRKERGSFIYYPTPEALAHIGITATVELPDYQKVREALAKIAESLPIPEA